MLPSKVFGFMFLSDLLFIAYLWRYGPCLQIGRAHV